MKLFEDFWFVVAIAALFFIILSGCSSPSPAVALGILFLGLVAAAAHVTKVAIQRQVQAEHERDELWGELDVWGHRDHCSRLFRRTLWQSARCDCEISEVINPVLDAEMKAVGHG